MVEFYSESPRLDRDMPRLAEHVRLLEHLGFDGVMFGEHVNQPETLFLSSRLPVLAALALVTERIKLGTMLLILPMYHPVHLARDAAVVDQITRGRLVLGVGLGYQKQDFNSFGIPFAERVSRFEEGLEILRRAWTERTFSYYGRHFELLNAGISPTPYQQPHPPIIVAAGSREGVKRAARAGDGVVLDSWQNLGTVKRYTQLYRDLTNKRGRRPSITLNRNILLSESREKALQEHGEGILRMARYSWSHGYGAADFIAWTKQGRTPEDLTVEDVIEDRMLCGSPAEVVDQIAMWLDVTGADHVNLRFPGADANLDTLTRTWQLFADKVIPRFK